MSDNAKMVFADNLKSYLNAKGLTQLDLANYMGCSSSTVSDWCKGASIPALIKCSVWQIGWVFGCPTLPVSTINSMMPI